VLARREGLIPWLWCLPSKGLPNRDLFRRLPRAVRNFSHCSVWTDFLAAHNPLPCRFVAMSPCASTRGPELPRCVSLLRVRELVQQRYLHCLPRSKDITKAAVFCCNTSFQALSDAPLSVSAIASSSQHCSVVNLSRIKVKKESCCTSDQSCKHYQGCLRYLVQNLVRKRNTPTAHRASLFAMMDTLLTI
jgi:hypothetical protein